MYKNKIAAPSFECMKCHKTDKPVSTSESYAVLYIPAT